MAFMFTVVYKIDSFEGSGFWNLYKSTVYLLCAPTVIFFFLLSFYGLGIKFKNNANIVAMI